MCINMTNEKLQLHFNDHIFRIEQEEYAREKIDFSKVHCVRVCECVSEQKRLDAWCVVLIADLIGVERVRVGE